MASTGKVMHVARHLLVNSRRLLPCIGSNRRRSTSVQSTDVEYPPIKPRFPPGKYGEDIKKKGSAAVWKEYEKGNEVLAIPNVKERLESISGTESLRYFRVEPCDDIPGSGKYKQFISKTHIENALPACMTEIDCDQEFTALRSLILDAIVQEHEFHYIQSVEKGRLSEKYHDRERTKFLLTNIVNIIIGYCSADNNYLLRSQVDRDVRVETFWNRTGFDAEGVSYIGMYTPGRFRLQYKGNATCQVRTELPLPTVRTQLSFFHCNF